MTNNRVRNLSKIGCLMVTLLTLSFSSITTYAGEVQWTCDCLVSWGQTTKSGRWDGMGDVKMAMIQTCGGAAISCTDTNGYVYKFNK